MIWLVCLSIAIQTHCLLAFCLWGRHRLTRRQGVSPPRTGRSRFRESGSPLLRCLLMFPSSSASHLLHTASDSISVSPVSGFEAVKAVSLSPVFGLSLLFPTLIPWTVQVCLAAGPLTGQPWVVWRLRCLPGSARSGLLSLCFPCLDNPVFTPWGRDGVLRCPFRPCDPSVRRACRLVGLKETSPDFPSPAGTAFQ